MSVNSTITISTLFCKFHTDITINREITHTVLSNPGEYLLGFLYYDAAMNVVTKI